jgi:CheY-like chemotaxis protein
MIVRPALVAMTLACPRCAAVPGKHCTKPRSRISCAVHKERIDAARQWRAEHGDLGQLGNGWNNQHVRVQTEVGVKPKKVILYVNRDPTGTSIRKFLLETHGYAVSAEMDADAALSFLSERILGSVDLLLVDFADSGESAEDLAERARELHAGLPYLLIPRGALKPAEVITRVRALVRRLRGPRLGGQIYPASRYERLVGRAA